MNPREPDLMGTIKGTGVMRRYWALHIPSNDRSLRIAEFNGDTTFYRELDAWNSNQPGTWQYWAA